MSCTKAKCYDGDSYFQKSKQYIIFDNTKYKKNADNMEQEEKDINETSGKVRAPVRVIIADDHFLVRKELKNAIEKEDSIIVVGEFEKINDVIENVQVLEPDIIFLDTTFPDISGTEAVSLLLNTNPDLKIIALTMPDSSEIYTEYINSGAKGYVFKNASDEELISATEKVQNGEIFDILKEREIKNKENEKRTSRSALKENILTDKEAEILIYIVNGMSNKEISEKLSISMRTAETHRHNIKKKLNISSAAGLRMYAIEAGLLKQ